MINNKITEQNTELLKNLLVLESLRLFDLAAVKTTIIMAIESELNKIENKGNNSRDYLRHSDIAELKDLLKTFKDSRTKINNQWESVKAQRTAIIKAENAEQKAGQ